MRDAGFVSRVAHLESPICSFFSLRLCVSAVQFPMPDSSYHPQAAFFSQLSAADFAG
jgi:hypothetical protein